MPCIVVSVVMPATCVLVCVACKHGLVQTRRPHVCAKAALGGGGGGITLGARPCVIPKLGIPPSITKNDCSEAFGADREVETTGACTAGGERCGRNYIIAHKTAPFPPHSQETKMTSMSKSRRHKRHGTGHKSLHVDQAPPRFWDSAPPPSPTVLDPPIH